MRHRSIVIAIVIGLFIGMAICSAQEVTPEPTQTSAIPEPKVRISVHAISVEGRLAVEKHGKTEELILHSKDANAYLIKGDFIEELKNTLSKLGENHLVSVTGIPDDLSDVACRQSYEYSNDEKGDSVVKIDTKCIRYNYLNVDQILWAKQSDEIIPPPKRDVAEENRLANMTAVQDTQSKPVTGQIFGKITAMNFKSPIKTIDVANRDTTSPLKAISVIVSNQTRIAKQLKEGAPIQLTRDALKVNQEVTVIYSRDEFKKEALFITVTKE